MLTKRYLFRINVFLNSSNTLLLLYSSSDDTFADVVSERMCSKNKAIFRKAAIGKINKIMRITRIIK